MYFLRKYGQNVRNSNEFRFLESDLEEFRHKRELLYEEEVKSIRGFLEKYNVPRFLRSPPREGESPQDQ